MKQAIPYNIIIKPNLEWAFFNPVDIYKHNSFLLNLKTNERNDKICTNEYKILDISHNGELVALSSKKWDSKNHNEFIVKEVNTNKLIFQTNKYLVYKAYFSKNNDYILTSTCKNNGFCLRIGKNVEQDKLSYPINDGILQDNKYIMTSERKKSTLIAFDFDTLSFSEQIINETKVTIQQICLDKLGNLYTIDKNFVVRKHTPTMECLWEVKFKKDDYNFCNTAPKFYIIDELDLLVFYAPNQKNDILPRTYIGQKLSTGQKIEIENKGEKTGFIESVYYENKIIDSFGVILDLETGLTETIFA